MSDITKLKRLARRLALRIRDASDSAGCGNSLLGYIRPQFAEDQAEFGRVLARLREIDPECPQ